MIDIIQELIRKKVSVAGIVSILQQRNMNVGFRNYQDLKKHVEYIIQKLNQSKKE